MPAEIVQRIQEKRVLQTPEAVRALFFGCADLMTVEVHGAFHFLHVDACRDLIPDVREKGFRAVISPAFIFRFVCKGRGQRVVSMA